MARCPLCRARLAGAATCPRCGADLASAQAAGSQAEHDLKQALAWLAAGKRQRAAVCTNRALWLHHTPLAEAVAGWLKGAEGPASGCEVQDIAARPVTVRPFRSRPGAARDSGLEPPAGQESEESGDTRKRISRLMGLLPHKR